MAILIAKLTLIKCEQDHGKHVKEEFSFIKRDPLRSCAICIDMVQGISDWEIQLLLDSPNPILPERLMMASNIRNMAIAASR